MSRRGPSLDAFLAAGGTHGEHFLVWRAPQPVARWITVLWGRPTEPELVELTRIYDFVFDARLNERFVSLVDCGQLTSVDADAFAVLAAYMQRRRADFERQLVRQAVVRPDGVIGAIVTGFFDLLGYRLPLEISGDTQSALRWLLDGAAGADAVQTASELAARIAAAGQTPPVLRALNDLFADRLDVDLAEAARRLGLSTRTLQRQLTEAGTAFRSELGRARVRRAQQLLAETDRKVTAIALEVGCASLQHFAQLFRDVTGHSLKEWRARAR